MEATEIARGEGRDIFDAGPFRGVQNCRDPKIREEDVPKLENFGGYHNSSMLCVGMNFAEARD